MVEELLSSVFGISVSKKLEFSTIRDSLSEHIKLLNDSALGRKYTHSSNDQSDKTHAAGSSSLDNSVDNKTTDNTDTKHTDDKAEDNKTEDNKAADNKTADNKATSRLGPLVVQLSRTANLGPLVLSEGDTEIEAGCHLGSALGTACVLAGRWMYEAVLAKGGIQQIGWAGALSVGGFTNEQGVGDGPDSYAFDGHRRLKWHEASHPYGDQWVAGDVIGSCLDLESGSITYYRNGVSMGVAFTELRKGMGYFPAISLSYGEKCLFNFGRRPFEYPVDGYAPLQAPPSVPAPSASLSPESVSYLLDCLRNLLRIEHARQQSNVGPLAQHDDTLITASILFEYLAPLLCTEYHVVDVLYPYLLSLAAENVELVTIIIEWMQLLMEEFEWKQCVGFLLQYVGFKCRTTGLIQAMRLDSANAQESRANNTQSHRSNTQEPRSNNTPPAERTRFSALALAASLLRIPHVLNLAASLEGIFSVLESFFTFKQPNKTDLAVLLPYVWWQGAEGNPDCSETRFRQDLAALNSYICVYDNLICEIVEILVKANSTEIVDSTSANTTQNLSLFFYNWLTYLIGKNKGANRNVLPLGLSSPSVLVNTYSAILRILFRDDTPMSVSEKHLDMFDSLFHQTTGTISEFSRLGGALGHLQKTIPNEAGARLNSQLSLEVVMLDAVVILYHLGVSNRFKANAQQHNSVHRDLAQLKEGRGDANILPRVVDGMRLINYSRVVLVGDKAKTGETSNRYPAKQDSMYKKTVFLAELLMSSSKQGSPFSFVPEYYMETMVECFHSLRRAASPLPLTTDPTYTPGLDKILTAFVSFFNEPRIVNPDVRDLLLQAMGVLMQYSEYVTFVDSLASVTVGGEPIQTALVRGLLQTFDKKFWTTVTSILVKLWKGQGLGESHDEATLNRTKGFRNVFAEVVAADPSLLDTFLNTLFNVLNSTISEFFVMKLDVSTMSPNDIRKANFLCELSTNLLRMLEFISVQKPDALLGSEINMMRLVELLLLILSRTVIVPEASRLDAILILEPHVTRSWLWAPLVGILLSLHKHATDSHSLFEALLSDASFKIEAFDFLLEYTWKQETQSTEWLKDLEVFVEKLKAQETARKSSASGLPKSASMDLCSICYGAPIDTQFEPCKHSSCHRCISRHLLNNKRCFFCNADVESTHPINT